MEHPSNVQEQREDIHEERNLEKLAVLDQDHPSQSKPQTQEKSNGKYFLYSHILEAQRNKGRGLKINLSYDPLVFWNSIGATYYRNFQKKEQFQIGMGWVIDRLKTLQIESLLDCGTGFGRVLPFLIDSGAIKRGTGIDFCKDLLDCSAEYFSPPDKVWCDHIKFKDGFWHMDNVLLDESWKACPKCNSERPLKPEKEVLDISKFIDVREADVRHLPFESESFDCSFSFECLQHLAEEDVEKSVREMVRVSNRIVMIIERWAFPGERFEPHYFSHNYSDLIKSLGLNILQVSSIGNGLQGVIAVKR